MPCWFVTYMSVFHSQYITDLLWIMPAHQEPACAAMLIVWSSLRIDQTQTTFFVTLPTKIPLVFLFSSCIWGVPLCSWKKMNCGFIGRLHNIPPPLSLSLSLCLSVSVSLSLGAYCHPASLSAGLYLPLFFTPSPHWLPLPSLSSLILFMRGAHSIILSPYISVCPSFSLHLSAPERDGRRAGGTDGREKETEREREERERWTD